MFQNEPTNNKRYNLLKALSSSSPNPEELAWLTLRYQDFTDSIRTPKSGDEHIFLELAKSHDGVEALLNKCVLLGLPYFWVLNSSRIIPSLMHFKQQEFNADFAELVFQERNAISEQPTQVRSIEVTCTNLLRDAVETVDFFALRTPNQPTPHYTPYHSYLHRPPAPSPMPSPDIAFKFIKACMNTGNSESVLRVCQRLVSTSDIDQESINLRTTAVLVPLIPRVGKLLHTASSASANVPGIDLLCNSAIQVYTKQMQTRLPTKDDIAALLEAVALSGNADILQNT
jgi:hypothetical protein